MPAGAPTLSIIVPSYNHGRYLPQTLDSIFRQTPAAQEIWVIDGGSTDDTVAVLQDYARRHHTLRWLSEPDSGPADAVNKGLARVTGDVIGVQSADDFYHDGAFAVALAAFTADDQLGVAYGDADVVDEQGRTLMQPRLPPFDLETLLCLRLSIPQSSAFFRRSLAREIGGWNGRYFGCDLEFWLRAVLHAPARKLDRVLSGWRQHPGQRTSPNRRAWDDYWSMIEESPDLRRAPPAVRRAALASRHILALYLHPTGAPWALRWHALCALALYPGFVRHVPRHRWYPLVPGYPLARALRRKMVS